MTFQNYFTDLQIKRQNLVEPGHYMWDSIQ